MGFPPRPPDPSTFATLPQGSRIPPWLQPYLDMLLLPAAAAGPREGLFTPDPQLAATAQAFRQAMPQSQDPTVQAIAALQQWPARFGMDVALDATTPGGAALNLVPGEQAIGPAVGIAVPAIKGIEKLLGRSQTLKTAYKGLTDFAKRYPRFAKAAGKAEAQVALKGAERAPAAALDRLAGLVVAKTHSAGGATVHPLTGQIQEPGVDFGFMFGKYANQSGKTLELAPADFTPARVRAFIEQHADELANDRELAVGAWKGGNGNFFLDVSQKVPVEFTDDMTAAQREAAIAGARRKAVVTAANEDQPASLVRPFGPKQQYPMVVNGRTIMRDVELPWPMPQEAVFDLQNANDVPVGNLAEFLQSKEFQDRLDEMYKAGLPVMNGRDWWNIYGTDLERVYGKENMQTLAGLLASTSPQNSPVPNLRYATEYMRRLLKGEPVVQPNFTIPQSAVGFTPGKMMGSESTRAANLERVAAGQMTQLQADKVNDMYHALIGNRDVAVMDRRYAKLAEDWKRGIFVDAIEDTIQGSMIPRSKVTPHLNVSPYALIENAVRDGAKRYNMDPSEFSAIVWEGIGETIQKTDQLFGMAHPGSAIPPSSGGFPGIFMDMVTEKAKSLKITVAEMEKRLRNGDAELLAAILSTPAGLAAYQQWQQAGPRISLGAGQAPPQT